jgi:predicted membrane protein
MATLIIFVAVFWNVVRITDIYRSAIVGALFEILWLPMIVMLLVLPVIAVYFLVKEKFSFRSLHLYSILILAFTLLGAFVLK